MFWIAQTITGTSRVATVIAVQRDVLDREGFLLSDSSLHRGDARASCSVGLMSVGRVAVRGNPVTPHTTRLSPTELTKPDPTGAAGYRVTAVPVPCVRVTRCPTFATANRSDIPAGQSTRTVTGPFHSARPKCNVGSCAVR